jgi:hypothetical protein
LDQNDLKLKKLMKKIKNTYCLYIHSLPVWIWKVTHTVTVYDRIRQHTIIYDRIRQSYSSVYGVETVTFKSLLFFIRSPYTVSVSHRFTPYTVPVYGSCVRPPYISVFHRKRSFTTVHVRLGWLWCTSSNTARKDTINHSFFLFIFNGIDYTIRRFTRSGHGHYRSI